MWAVANYCIIHAREVNSLLGQDVGAAQRILPACEQGTRAGGEKEMCHLGRNDAVEVGEAKRSGEFMMTFCARNSRENLCRSSPRRLRCWRRQIRGVIPLGEVSG